MSKCIIILHETNTSVRTYRIFNSSLTLLGTVTTAPSTYRFAVNSIESWVYHRRPTTNGIQCRSFDATLLYTSAELSDDQQPFVIDKYGQLWTWDDGGNTIHIWSFDLTTETTYTLKAGNVLGDYITGACMTLDGDYVYLVGGGATANEQDWVAKYALANLDDGDPEWTKNVGELLDPVPLPAAIRGVCVDADNNVYVSDAVTSGGDRIVGLSESDGSYLWSSPYYITGHRYLCQQGDRLYVPYRPNTNLRQYDPSDGSLVGNVYYTDDYSISTYWTAIYDSTILFFGSLLVWTDHPGLFTWDITDDLGEDEGTPLNTYTAGYATYSFDGDPTGYLHEQILESERALAGNMSGLDIDPTRKYVLVCDKDNDQLILRWLYGQEEITTKTTYGDSDEYHFCMPMDCCYDDNQWYVCDTMNHIVIQFNFDLSYKTYFGTRGIAGNDDSHFQEPTGICTDQEYLYISDRINDRIVKLTVDLVYDSASSISLDSPMGIAYDGTNFHICDTGNDRIVIMASDLTLVDTYGSTGTGDGEFDTPVDITIRDSIVHVVDQGNNRVQAFETDGTFLQEVSHDTMSSETTISTPNGIAWYSDSIFVTEEDETVIRTWYPYRTDVTDNSWTLESTANEGVDWDKLRDDQVDSTFTEETEADSTWTEETETDSTWTEETEIDSTWTEV